MIRKDIIIAILATFFLTITLFIVLPTRSSPSAREYDSWADINGDGAINMYDIAYSAQRFGTSGDPTKDVNVTNWAYPAPKTILYETYDLVWNSTYPWGLPIKGQSQKAQYVGDYSTMSIFIHVDNAYLKSGGAFWGLRAYWSDGNGVLSAPTLLPVTCVQLSQYAVGYQTGVTSYPVLGPYICLYPSLINWREADEGLSEGNVTLSVLLNLSNGPSGESTTSDNVMAYRVETRDNYISLGDHNVKGYGKFTINLMSNISIAYLDLYGSGQYNVGNILLDHVTGLDSYEWFSRTYDVTIPQIFATVGLLTEQAVKLEVFIYLTP